MNHGYIRVELVHSQVGREIRYVHNLVLTAFRGPCPDGLVARHLDGVPTNNALHNLVWGTPLENHWDRIVHRRALKKLSPEQVQEVLQSPLSGAEWARRLGVRRGTINRLRQRWSHGYPTSSV